MQDGASCGGCQVVRHQAELTEVTMESSTAEAPFTILHIHTRTPCTLPTSRPLTFTWPHSHSQTLIHYTKEIEIELLNNFVRRNGVHIFHISCKADSQLVSEWFSPAVVTMYEHSMLLYTACRDLLMERDR